MDRRRTGIVPGNRSLHDFVMREAAVCSRMAPKGMERRPTPAMMAALRNMSEGRPAFAHLRGRSAMGGAERTRAALQSRGWMSSDFAITDLGRAAYDRFS